MLNTENPFMNFVFTYEMLANMNGLNVPKGPLPENLQPYAVAVEAVRGRDIPETDPPEAFRYVLAFPGSSFLKVGIKVKEAAPSFTASDLAARGGFIRVAVEGFTSGSMLTDDGGVRPYFRAKRIVPIADSPSHK